MDNIKETVQSVFSKLLDPAIQTNPFGANRSGERAYRRAERIVAAIILLTNHISIEDELRRRSRHVALVILELLLDIKDEMRSLSSERTRDLHVKIRHLISLVRMLVFGGFISSQNAELTIVALEELNTFLITSARSSLSESLQLSREDFTDIQVNYKGHIKDIRDRAIIKDKMSIKDLSVKAIGQLPSPTGPASLSTRGQGIVSILKIGGELNLPDIAAHLPEYGEKTIQRELGLLMGLGIVKRTGLKRWSRYSLTSQPA